MTFDKYFNYWCMKTHQKPLSEWALDHNVFSYHEAVCRIVERYKMDVVTVQFVMEESTYRKVRLRFEDLNITLSNKIKADNIITVDLTGLKDDIVTINNLINGHEKEK